jgi:hypothetical protein
MRTRSGAGPTHASGSKIKIKGLPPKQNNIGKRFFVFLFLGFDAASL